MTRGRLTSHVSLFVYRASHSKCVREVLRMHSSSSSSTACNCIRAGSCDEKTISSIGFRCVLGVDGDRVQAEQRVHRYRKSNLRPSSSQNLTPHRSRNQMAATTVSAHFVRGLWLFAFDFTQRIRYLDTARGIALLAVRCTRYQYVAYCQQQ